MKAATMEAPIQTLEDSSFHGSCLHQESFRPSFLLEEISIEAFMQTAAETLINFFVEASMEASMKTASTEVYFLLSWELEV